MAALSAGSERGGYFIPQVGDEVLVAFNQGDVKEPYILGTLWNGRDKPPSPAPTDPAQKRAIRTPIGHEVLLDDAEQKDRGEDLDGSDDHARTRPHRARGRGRREDHAIYQRAR